MEQKKTKLGEISITTHKTHVQYRVVCIPVFVYVNSDEEEESDQIQETL